MEPLSSAQASQMWLDRSWMLLDFFCQIHSSSSTAVLPVGPAEGQDGELLLKVIAVDDPEFFHSVGGSTVLPMGTDGQVCVPDPVVQNVPAVLQKERIARLMGVPPQRWVFFSV